MRSVRLIAGLVIVALAALAATATASRSSLDEAATASAASREDLAAPLQPPQEVFIQKTSQFPGRGNVLVSVQLTPEQVSARQTDGTADFITIGGSDAQTILRDDGRGADGKAGDGLFTGIATVDEASLAERAESDRTDLTNRGSGTSPLFAGRVIVGTDQQEPFDFEAFRAGAMVPLGPAVAFVEPESSLQSSGTGTTSKAVVLGTNPFQQKVLMITNTGVVTDPARTRNPCAHPGNGLPVGTPNGVWTFEHLMTEMANEADTGIPPAKFVEDWLLQWTDPHLINADNVVDRDRMLTLIARWRTESGGAGAPLNLSIAPFRLLSIVSRVDLRTTTGGGGGYGGNVSGNFLDAGEARFIFGVVLRPGWSGTGFGAIGTPSGPVVIPGTAIGAGTNNTCRAMPFTVIFEYRVPKCKCEDVRAWARSWIKLNTLVPGPGSAYNAHLEGLTRQFTRRNANRARANGNALGQLRTNELTLVDVPQPWELREFQLAQFPFTPLVETTTADTPQNVFNNTATFEQWVRLKIMPAIAPPFDQPIPPVPLLFDPNPPSVPINFMAGKAQVTGGPGFFWNAPGLNSLILHESWGRHRAGLAACNGCHARETNTPFVHVDPTNLLGPVALPAEISGFLSGITVADPVNGAISREFDDLARREIDIKRVAKMRCFDFHPINVAHVLASIKLTGALPDDLFGDLPPVTHHEHVSVAVDDMRRNIIGEVH